MTIPGETKPTPSAPQTRIRVVGSKAPEAGLARPSLGRRPRSFWAACALALAVLGLSLGLSSALARKRALEIENAALTADLARTRDALAAYRARLGEVRTRVGELRERVGSLDALLAIEPGAPAAAPPAAAEPNALAPVAP